MLSVVLAINWEPELRGILTVLIGVAVWMGSIYLILGTNMGARLGFVVTLTGLMGWMSLMAGIWWMYGIGLKGDVPTWTQVEGRTVIQDVGLLANAGVLDDPIEFTKDDDPLAASSALATQLLSEGWSKVDASAPEFGQAQSQATVFLEEEDALDTGEYAVTAIFEIDPPHESAFPKLGPNGEFDQIAFFHKPYYTLVEVAPYTELREEAGRAPTPPQIDDTQQRQYVYMVRDLGSLREPAAMICIGSTIAFLALCLILHRRDRFVALNLERKAIAAADG
jgi:hypothetical protein